MTTFTIYWERRTTKHPSLANEAATVTMTAREYRRQLQSAYDCGYQAGKEVGSGGGNSFWDTWSRGFGG